MRNFFAIWCVYTNGQLSQCLRANIMFGLSFSSWLCAFGAITGFLHIKAIFKLSIDMSGDDDIMITVKLCPHINLFTFIIISAIYS